MWRRKWRRKWALDALGTDAFFAKFSGQAQLGKARSPLPPLNFLHTSVFYGFPPATTTTDPRPDSGRHRKNGYRHYRPQAQDVSENGAQKDTGSDAPGL